MDSSNHDNTMNNKQDQYHLQLQQQQQQQQQQHLQQQQQQQYQYQQQQQPQHMPNMTPQQQQQAYALQQQQQQQMNLQLQLQQQQQYQQQMQYRQLQQHQQQQSPSQPQEALPHSPFSSNYMKQQNSQTSVSQIHSASPQLQQQSILQNSIPNMQYQQQQQQQPQSYVSSSPSRNSQFHEMFAQPPSSPSKSVRSANLAPVSSNSSLISPQKRPSKQPEFQYSNPQANNSNSNLRYRQTIQSLPPPSLPQQQQQQQQQPPQTDYVIFDRHPEWFSKPSQDRASAIKLKLEHYYKTAIEHAIERNQRRITFEQKLGTDGSSGERKNRELQLFGKNESQFLRLRRTRLSLEDFNTVKVIGKGAFGEVRLVQKKDTGKIYAMKTLLKSEMYKKDQLAHVKAERDVLADANSPWVVSLYYSFQDPLYLYLIMEFLPGGDLMTMLIKWQIFTEDVTRFYIAECVLAIEAIHKLGFIHRDIKPDNILIDMRGHIKLSDFGLSTGFHKTHDSNYYRKLLEQDGSSQFNSSTNSRNSVMVDPINLTMSNRMQMQTWRKSRRLMAYSTVGTPDYIAPEIFVNQGYGQTCDWWSLGAIMFECLVGWPPFCSETPKETYRKILNWKETLQFPEDVHLSPEAEDLILRLLTNAENRLGRHGGADEIKAHPFFRGVNWEEIRNVEAPFIPKLRSITDTRFFPTDELENVPDSPALAQAAKEREGMKVGGAVGVGEDTKEDLPFIGYTFSRFEYLTRRNAL
ncbi:hypothetical protein CANARDRAFT_26886 [[Candida] arabinofermentans NRRL YB-2248]|uniref:Serine/threonine-protein kinase CBK1 n=1 Tax=[Candida] arabinofermentans NRRL YB-2248 TaxID=983967 RepID=A0A1E4T6U9_9ASCO|nr:hypothetical protein CANARDRAFT_26886 [[Candida] arabinofermentans NRRL YB-2248]